MLTADAIPIPVRMLWAVAIFAPLGSSSTWATGWRCAPARPPSTVPDMTLSSQRRLVCVTLCSFPQVFAGGAMGDLWLRWKDGKGALLRTMSQFQRGVQVQAFLRSAARVPDAFTKRSRGNERV